MRQRVVGGYTPATVHEGQVRGQVAPLRVVSIGERHRTDTSCLVEVKVRHIAVLRKVFAHQLFRKNYSGRGPGGLVAASGPWGARGREPCKKDLAVDPHHLFWSVRRRRTPPRGKVFSGTAEHGSDRPKKGGGNLSPPRSCALCSHLFLGADNERAQGGLHGTVHGYLPQTREHNKEEHAEKTDECALEMTQRVELSPRKLKGTFLSFSWSQRLLPLDQNGTFTIGRFQLELHGFNTRFVNMNTCSEGVPRRAILFRSPC